MRALTLVLLAMWLAVGSVRIAAQAPAGDIQKLDYVLNASKYTVKRLTDAKVAVWAIERQGTHIGNFQIRVTTEKGIVVTFVTVARKNNIRKMPDLFEKMLKLNQDFDYVKVAFDDDGDAFVRIDNNLRILDVDEMNAVIAQVSIITDNFWVALKPYLIVS